jgi:glycosyltransferase involved in cell wall biosynthesis
VGGGQIGLWGEGRYNRVVVMERKMEDEKRPLRVCYFGTYRANYVRNEVLIEGLKRLGVEVYECHSTLWHSVSDRVAQAGGGWKSPRFLSRVIKAYWKLFRTHNQTPEYDVMLVGYPGQFDVYLGRLLSWWRRKPMSLDILMSLHLVAEERGLTKKSPFTGKLIFWLEKLGLKLPDSLIVDTPEYRDYYCEKYKLSSANFSFLSLGVDDRLYYPRLEIEPAANCFRVIYYGTFIPLHGVETMLLAAAELQDTPDIKFYFFGEGQEEPKARALAQELALENVCFQGWTDKSELPNEISKSHICLGVFGTTKQSRCTIQNKIWEGMMMQRPVITGDAQTIREELTHKEHVYLVERANPKALADGILTLQQDSELREYIVQQAFTRVQENTIDSIGRLLIEILLNLVHRKDITS